MSKITKEEREKSVAIWIAALRSGRYEQCQEKLSDGVGYCCLGVACEVLNIPKKKLYGGEISYCGNVNTLPREARILLGLRDPAGFYNDGSLTKLNDDGMSFSEIADIIESRPLGLFFD